jgi:hypothetical protein
VKSVQEVEDQRDDDGDQDQQDVSIHVLRIDGSGFKFARLRYTKVPDAGVETLKYESLKLFRCS